MVEVPTLEYEPAVFGMISSPSRVQTTGSPPRSPSPVWGMFAQAKPPIKTLIIWNRR